MWVLGFGLWLAGIAGIVTVAVRHERDRQRAAETKARLVRLGRSGQPAGSLWPELEDLQRRVRARAQERIVSDEQTGAAA